MENIFEAETSTGLVTNTEAGLKSNVTHDTFFLEKINPGLIWMRQCRLLIGFLMQTGRVLTGMSLSEASARKCKKVGVLQSSEKERKS